MGYADMETTFTHPDGRVFNAELGKIRSSHFGVEHDHGMLAVTLDFEFRGSGQGLGYRSIGRCWSEYNRDVQDDPSIENYGPGTTTSDNGHVHKMYASGAQFLIQLMNVVGSNWENLVGNEVWVLREARYGGGMIQGLVNKGSTQRFLILDDFFEETKELDA